MLGETVPGSGTAIKQNFMTFKDRLLNSMTFQVRKMKCLNSMTFQVFYDLYEPCNKRECQPSSLIGTCLTLPKLGFLWVFFKYPKISKNGNLLFFPVNKASSTCIRIFLNPQLFLSGYGFRPHVSGESDKWIRNFLNHVSRVEIFEYVMNPESCGR